MDEPGRQGLCPEGCIYRRVGAWLLHCPPLRACPPHTRSLVKQMDSTPITAQPVGELRGAPGQAPRGARGCGRGAPCAELLPRLELAAQFGDTLLFLEEGRQVGAGSQGLGGWGQRKIEDRGWVDKRN